MLVQRWRHLYNRVRPHSALTYRPPAPETIEPLTPGSPELLDIGEQKLTQKWDNFRGQVKREQAGDPLPSQRAGLDRAPTRDPAMDL